MYKVIIYFVVALIDGSLYNVSDSAIGVSSTAHISLQGPQCSKLVTDVDGCQTPDNYRLWVGESWDEDPWIQVNNLLILLSRTAGN